MRSLPTTALVCSALLSIAVSAHAGNHFGLVTESVNKYQSGPNNCCSTCGDLGGSNASADGFYSGMVASPNSVGFSQSYQFKDSSVWDSDFLDPDLSSHAPCSPGSCDDTNNFDYTGTAAAFYQGHGAALTPFNIQCTSSNYTTQCSSANAPSGYHVGQSGYGACVQSPMSWTALGTGKGLCYYIQNTTVNPTLDVCGQNVNNNNHAQLGYIALGETPSSGSWRGAGTNGGTSLAIFHMSFGMWTWFPLSDWAPTFAGLQLYAGMSVSWDDVADASNYGGYVAQPYASNPHGEVADAYTNALTLETEGSGCTGSGSVNGGFNGCGCHVIISIGVSNIPTFSVLHETWYGLTSDNSNQTGTGYWYYEATCNYDTSTYPWQGGL